jgi:hypothetical protein
MDAMGLAKLTPTRDLADALEKGKQRGLVLWAAARAESSGSGPSSGIPPPPPTEKWADIPHDEEPEEDIFATKGKGGCAGSPGPSQDQPARSLGAASAKQLTPARSLGEMEFPTVLGWDPRVKNSHILFPLSDSHGMGRYEGFDCEEVKGKIPMGNRFVAGCSPLDRKGFSVNPMETSPVPEEEDWSQLLHHPADVPAARGHPAADVIIRAVQRLWRCNVYAIGDSSLGLEKDNGLYKSDNQKPEIEQEFMRSIY